MVHAFCPLFKIQIHIPAKKKRLQFHRGIKRIGQILLQFHSPNPSQTHMLLPVRSKPKTAKEGPSSSYRSHRSMKLTQPNYQSTVKPQTSFQNISPPNKKSKSELFNLYLCEFRLSMTSFSCADVGGLSEPAWKQNFPFAEALTLPSNRCCYCLC